MKNYSIHVIKILLSISALSISYSETSVSGVISSNTTWSLSSSPYIVIDNILVNEGVTLTVEAGVTVKMLSGKDFQVKGELIAQGTNASKITFTSNESSPAAGDWGQLLFDDEATNASFSNNVYASGSILEYCIVEYGEGLRLYRSSPFIHYSDLRYNSNYGIGVYSDISSNPEILVTNCSMYNNTVGISIDDADRSFLEIGWPLFKKFNFPVVLFISTNSISYSNKNYLNWDEIRQLKNEGVDIGSHLHSHSHFTDLTKEDLIKEIETSNKIFLKELDSIPTLFAYPYGETDEAFMDVLKDYKFKVAFGQHSGVINETSNMYYLPRFSLNEKYGDLERLQFTANTKGLGVYDFIPTDPIIFNNPPYIGFSLLDDSLSKTINCFIFDSKGTTESDLFKFNERIEIRLKRKLNKGRARLNCTAIDQKKQWRWFGHQFYIEDK